VARAVGTAVEASADDSWTERRRRMRSNEDLMGDNILLRFMLMFIPLPLLLLPPRDLIFMLVFVSAAITMMILIVMLVSDDVLDSDSSDLVIRDVVKVMSKTARATTEYR
jgi:hypothetical protein